MVRRLEEWKEEKDDLKVHYRRMERRLEEWKED